MAHLARRLERRLQRRQVVETVETNRNYLRESLWFSVSVVNKAAEEFTTEAQSKHRGSRREYLTHDSGHRSNHASERRGASAWRLVLRVAPQTVLGVIASRAVARRPVRCLNGLERIDGGLISNVRTCVLMRIFLNMNILAGQRAATQSRDRLSSICICSAPDGARATSSKRPHMCCACRDTKRRAKRTSCWNPSGARQHSATRIGFRAENNNAWRSRARWRCTRRC